MIRDRTQWQVSETVTTFDRRRRILNLLSEQPGIKVTELAELLGVSQTTIRNDLRSLEQADQLTRVRGGAVLDGKHPYVNPAFASRSRVNLAAKQRIARWAADMIHDGDTVFMDASTTVFHMAPFLQDVRNLTIVTNGIEVAQALAISPSHTVILIGGVLRFDGTAVAGHLSEKILEDLHVKTAFVSCSGFSIPSGLTEVRVDEAQLKAKVLHSSDQVVVLADSSKLGRVDFIPFASVEQIAHLVTDSEADATFLEQLRSACKTVTVCGENTVSSLTPCTQQRAHCRIGFTNLGEQILFCVDVRHGLEQAAQDAGSIDLIVADNHLNGEVALGVADRLIAAGVDLAIEYQIDDGVNSLIADKFQQAGIPLIAVDDPIVGATYFGVDNYRAGHMAGAALGNWVRQHWNSEFDRLIVLEEPRVASLPAARILGQLAGFQETVGEVPEAKLIRLDSGNTSDTSEAHMAQALDLLTGARRLAVITFNDDSAVGALAAARKAGREGDVIVVGQGADRLGRAEIRHPGSRLIGSTAFMPERYGSRLIPIAMDIPAGRCLRPSI